MATEAQVYDFEGQLELAVQAFFEASDIIAIKPGDDPQFQKERPRIELQVVVGPATGHLQPVTLDGEAAKLVHDAYTGSLMLAVLTEADYAKHVAYRTKIRAQVSRLIYLTTLDYHELEDVVPAGASQVLSPEDGTFESHLTYNLAFCVKSDAWPET